MTSPGSTYSPGSWYALVSPSAAVFVDPTMPGAQLDALWDGVLAGRGVDEALEVIRGGGRGRLPAFALAAVEGSRVRIVVRGAIQITVQDADGLERGISGAGVEPWREDVVDRAETLWFVRPGGGRDGLALPVVTAAVTADILAWQPDGVARRRGDHDGSTRRMEPLPVRAEARVEAPARNGSYAPSVAAPGGYPAAPGVPDGPLAPLPSRSDTVPAARSGVPDAVPSTAVPAPPVPVVSPAPVERLAPPAPTVASAPPAAAAPVAPPAPLVPPEPAPRPAVVPHAVVMSPPPPAPVPVPATVIAPVPVREPAPAPAAPAAVPAAPAPAAPAAPVPAAVPSVPAPEPAPAAGPRRYGLLHFSTGETVDVDGPVVIGRAPVQQDGEQARLVPVKGTGRGISRTHVRVAVDGLGVHVMDLGSRNGTVVKSPSGETFTLDPGVQHRLLDGQIVSMADVSFEFRSL